MSHSKDLASIETILDDARNGRMFILVDDEDRENEGDLVCPAQLTTPDDINFMAKYGRGLICLALSKERVDQLGLNLMSPRNGTRHETAFTVSIEAKEGVTTGISAADRARTIHVAMDPAQGPEAIVTPGHVFPLVARSGGVLVRAGHTEAAVDIAQLAGLTPAGVICEIMNDDGTMARLPDLIPFAKQHNLNIATIADLIAYRRRSEKMVKRLAETPFESVHGGAFRMIVYGTTTGYAEHVALVKGEPKPGTPTLVRMHALNLLSDTLGDIHGGRAGDLQAAMQAIGKAGSGVVVLLREPIPTALSDRVRERTGEQAPQELRDYGIGAQILLDLGVNEMLLLSNSKRSVIGLEGYGLTITGYQPINS
jgi:3,4-dihydroxy 2-butanone 4-phosphate synthase/GTP cyclohydrolase II